MDLQALNAMEDAGFERIGLHVIRPGDILIDNSRTVFPQGASFAFVYGATSPRINRPSIYECFTVGGARFEAGSEQLRSVHRFRLPISSYPCARIAKAFDIPITAVYGFAEFVQGKKPAYDPFSLWSIKAVGERTEDFGFLLIWTYLASYWMNANREGYFYARDV